jgi:hypothetical protein
MEGQCLGALLGGRPLVPQDGGDGLIRCLEKLGALLAPILSLEQTGECKVGLEIVGYSFSDAQPSSPGADIVC